jgi:hypothetical protein
LDSPKLKHDVVLSAAVTQLKVLDRCNAHTASKVQDERTQLNVPPRRTILKREQSVIIGRYVIVVGVNDIFIVQLIRILKALLQLLEASEHPVGGAAVVLFTTRLQVSLPLSGSNSI